ncbi:MAG: cupin domain-containing protein [Gemmatimonadetes bacterium]|nr:cupin domain-containing protein [Gemmatimonadota bacterium]
MQRQAVRFAEKFARFHDQWAPRTVARMNDVDFKLVRIQGEFVWHSHPETDEAFIVLHGSMEIQFRDGSVTLDEGDMLVVPRGVEHRPVAARECRILLVEPAGTLNTGDAGGPRTVAEAWI